jgi:hypothetical protein
MSIVVFLGPTLPVEEARPRLDARFLAPAQRGDVFLASLTKPSAIAIVDGFFDQVPAVWHKEILYAMSLGIQVFGAASMGALRAAELHTFGMRGVGRIFEAFSSGALEDDDEVVLTHATEELGYRPLSEAMVNVRATLSAAQADGVIDEAQRLKLEGLAKAMFYPERTYARLFPLAAGAGFPRSTLDTLRAWLPLGRVDQKRVDTLELLDVLRATRDQPPPATPVELELAETNAWLALRDTLTGGS